MTQSTQQPSGQPPSQRAGARSDEHAARHGALARAVRATGGMTLLSRFGGLARDVIVGRVFGVTVVGSAFAAAFAVPNMFRRLFGEGALSAAFIPAYADALREGRAPADALASLTVATLALVTTALTVVIELALLLVLLLAPQDAERALSLKLIMVMLPFMPLICVVAILAGMLQVHGRFGPAASGPLILNALIVGVGAWCLLTGQLAGEGVAYAFGIATVLSGATQCWWFLRLLRPHVLWTRAWAGVRGRASTMLRKFVPVALGLGTLQLNAFVDMLIAMWPVWVGPKVFEYDYPLNEGSNVILSLVQRLYQFPLGVFGIAVASAAFPLLARHAKDNEHFVDTLRRAVRMSVYVGIPASAGLILVRHEAVGVMFGHGKTGWSVEDLAKAASVLTGFAAGVWAYSLNHVFTRTFYAKGDTLTPMRVALAMVGLNLVLNVTLIWRLQEAGLAWGTSIAAIVQCGVLGVLARRMLGREGWAGGMLDRPTMRAAGKVVLATVVMSACVWAALRAMPDAPAGVSAWVWQATRLGVGLGVGGASYLGLSLVLGMREWRWLLGRV